MFRTATRCRSYGASVFNNLVIYKYAAPTALLKITGVANHASRQSVSFAKSVTLIQPKFLSCCF